MPSETTSTRGQEDRPRVRDIPLTAADKIVDDLTARCLAYNVSLKYRNHHNRTAAVETLGKWGQLMELSVYTVQEAVTLWEDLTK